MRGPGDAVIEIEPKEYCRLLKVDREVCRSRGGRRVGRENLF